MVQQTYPQTPEQKGICPSYHFKPKPLSQLRVLFRMSNFLDLQKPLESETHQFPVLERQIRNGGQNDFPIYSSTHTAKSSLGSS